MVNSSNFAVDLPAESCAESVHNKALAGVSLGIVMDYSQLHTMAAVAATDSRVFQGSKARLHAAEGGAELRVKSRRYKRTG